AHEVVEHCGDHAAVLAVRRTLERGAEHGAADGLVAITLKPDACTHRIGVARDDTIREGADAVAVHRLGPCVALHAVDRAAPRLAALDHGQPSLHLIGDAGEHVDVDLVTDESVTETAERGAGAYPRREIVVSHERRG